jgi:uncharacterized protein (DUF427 family)
MKAIWNETIIAETTDTVEVEGNHYFPKDSLNKEFLIESKYSTHCPWKGEASYFSIKVKDEVNKDCIWYYPNPKEKAQMVKNRVAFWGGVKVID